MLTLSNAISRFIDNGNVAQLEAARDLTTTKILNDVCAGIRWEDGEDTIASDAFKFGLEIAQSYNQNKVWEILAIIGN